MGAGLQPHRGRAPLRLHRAGLKQPQRCGVGWQWRLLAGHSVQSLLYACSTRTDRDRVCQSTRGQVACAKHWQTALPSRCLV
eukprot:366436-Chlamydomonas_euryale.AAC.22